MEIARPSFASVVITVAAVAAAVVTPLLAAPPLPNFRAVARHEQAVLLLDEPAQAIFVSRGGAAPTRAIPLRAADGSPWKWSRPPLAFAPRPDALLFVDGTDVLHRFSSGGQYVGRVKLPLRATAIVASRERVWLYDGLPSSGEERFWSSVDGQHFRPEPVALTSAAGDARAQHLRLQLTLGAVRDTLFYAHLIGPPVLNVLSNRRRAQWPLAYSRTAARDRLRAYENGVNDLNAYASPAAEIIGLADGKVIVVRNREDVVVGAAGVETWLRRRVDRYDSRGAHVATATFAETIRTVLHATDRHVVALTRTGAVARVVWGRPSAGGVITQP